MGSIRSAPRSRRWEARYRDPTGRQGTATFDRKSDATVFLAAAETDVARGHWRDPELGRAKFADVAQAWLESNPRKRPTTYARDAMVVRVHLNPLLGDLAMARVRPADVKAVVAAMEHRGLAPHTVRTSYGVLRAILSWAVANDVVDRSPCRGIRLPEPAKSSKPVVSAVDVAKLADAIGVDYRVAVFLGAVGLRQAEVFGLRVGSVDFLRRTLTVEATINEVEGKLVEGTGKTRSSMRTSPSRRWCSTSSPPTCAGPGGRHPRISCSRRPTAGRSAPRTSGCGSIHRRCANPASKASPSTGSATPPAT